MSLRSAIIISAAGVALAAGTPVFVRGAPPDASETKIRLMAGALEARDRGDFAEARDKLAKLQAMAPGDPNVRRILREVNARLQAPAAAPRAAPVVSVAPAAAPEVSAGAAPASREAEARPPAGSSFVMPVVRDEKPEGGPVPSPEPKGGTPLGGAAAAADAAAQALLQADDARLSKLVTYVQAERALARVQARDRNYAAAIATLDDALEELQKPVDALKAERADFARRKAQAEDDHTAGVRLRHQR